MEKENDFNWIKELLYFRWLLGLFLLFPIGGVALIVYGLSKDLWPAVITGMIVCIAFLTFIIYRIITVVSKRLHREDMEEEIAQ